MKTHGVHRALSCAPSSRREYRLPLCNACTQISIIRGVVWCGVRSIYVGWDIPNVEVVAIDRKSVV